MTVAHLIKLLEDNCHPDDEVFVEHPDGDMTPAEKVEYEEAWYSEHYPQFRYDYHKQGCDRSSHIVIVR